MTGKPLIRIGEEISEQLAFEPGKLYVIRYVRPKYASPDRRQGAEVGVKTAPLPDGPIDRCKADVSLFSHIIISKYCDHLSLHRQVEIFRRHEIELPKSSMCAWVRNSATALEPLYQLLRETVLKSDYINSDDTPIHFKNDKSQGTGKGHMWIYLCRVEKPPDEPPDSLLKKLMLNGEPLGWFHTDYMCFPDFHDMRVMVKQFAHLRLALLDFFNRGRMARPVEFRKKQEPTRMCWGIFGNKYVSTPPVLSAHWQFGEMHMIALSNTRYEKQRNTLVLPEDTAGHQLYVLDIGGKVKRQDNPSGELDFELPPLAPMIVIAAPPGTDVSALLKRLDKAGETVHGTLTDHDPFAAGKRQEVK
ncbi:MAG: Transposase IS66 family protein [Lentisphaerae bacterium ADurb.Bin242]|nr:MAG: Transposase IS66 family protein [Lentisphaerae bacterium ADurb.Bin242]